jgi:ribosomal protein S18 acetylase RimI-like enzyme
VADLIVADRTLLEQILDGTYPIWGEGLTRESYSAWNRGQMATGWGRSNLRRVALFDDGTLLASAKRYDFEARVGAGRVLVLGIGAVFTPVDQRGRGHARRLIELMVEDATARGCAYALLFSEIGAAFYESMGFRVVPRSLVSLEVIPKPDAGAPATFVRTGETADLPGIAEISVRYSEGAAFALDRSAELIGFGLARRRLLAGLSPAGRRQVEFFVAEEGGRAAAYVFITRGPSGVVLEECGDRDPSGARIGAILQVLAAREPADPLSRMTAWLPRDLWPPQVDVIAGGPAAEIMMMRPLRDVASDLHPVVYWQSDIF